MRAQAQHRHARLPPFQFSCGSFQSLATLPGLHLFFSNFNFFIVLDIPLTGVQTSFYLGDLVKCRRFSLHPSDHHLCHLHGCSSESQLFANNFSISERDKSRRWVIISIIWATFPTDVDEHHEEGIHRLIRVSHDSAISGTLQSTAVLS